MSTSRRSTTQLIRLFVVLLISLIAAPQALAAEDLAGSFAKPPAAARPWVYWFWLNGNITREGITADLEAMQRVGIGGVLIMEVDQGAPLGPVAFAGPQWRTLFKHAVTEAHRLGLQINMSNDAGWCGSGGPWITPDLAMQKVVWSETRIQGPIRLDATLPKARAVAGYYRDIAVLAFPTPADDDPANRIEDIRGKADFETRFIPPRIPETPVEPLPIIPQKQIVNLTPKLSTDGKLTWDVPEGSWTILRIGHTPTGKDNHPAPESGRGLECDKLSTRAVDVMFAGLMQKIIDDAGPLAGQSLVATHIDSWEVGSQNWTPRFREEFQRLRGYDPLPFLPALSGRVVDSPAVSDRFLFDLRQTVSDLLVDNYAGHFAQLAKKHGMHLSIEAYGGPCDDIPYAGRADEPMCEFWIGGGAFETCKEMASAAHIYGKRILGAESFTSGSDERWLQTPATIKALGDRAFCAGVNRFVFHRYAMQPWLNRVPGMTMGPWGLHYERTETWWNLTSGWHEYLARCQYMLRQGRFVADALYLQPEMAPQAYQQHDRGAFDFDNCSAEALFTRVSVKDGRLVLPDGMSYRVLVLPHVQTMTPKLLGRIRDLVRDGATVVGTRPIQSPSLTDYPNCDAQVKQIADELWGTSGSPAGLATRTFGKGRLVLGTDLEQKAAVVQSMQARFGKAQWIWHHEGNPAQSAPVAGRYFRKAFTLDKGGIRAARLSISADNSFTLWINGKRAGAGDDWHRPINLDVTRLLKAGDNLLAVLAENGATTPNPAGLIAALTVTYQNGKSFTLETNRDWQSATTAGKDWFTDAAGGNGWAPVLALGRLGIAPWGNFDGTSYQMDFFPDARIVSRVLAEIGVGPDFQSDHDLGYIHRRDGDTDIYFVANGQPHAITAQCVFRVSGKAPQLWDPLTGRITPQPVFLEKDGTTQLPLTLGPSGSVFVVFRATALPAAERIVSITHDGQPICQAAYDPADLPPSDNNRSIADNFTMAFWVKPGTTIALPVQTSEGAAALTIKRNDAIYPPPGHEVYNDDTQAGVGISVGTNGICVLEHGVDTFAPVLVHAAPLTDWTHVVLVFRNGGPSLYLNGKFVARGVAGTLSAHPGAGVHHTRHVDPFDGLMSRPRVFAKPLSDAEIAALPGTMPRVPQGNGIRPLQIVRAGAGSFHAVASKPGSYTLATADGRSHTFQVPSIPAPMEVTGAWDVHFAPGMGAPAQVRLEKLISWSQHTDPGVRYFSGSATYTRTLEVPASLLAPGRRILLDLGRVQVMAQVKLNGRDLGVLWHSPYQSDVTNMIRPGENQLEVTVTNQWPNRMIGDEQLPEDSDRRPDGTLRRWPEWLNEGKPSPTGRYTFTSWRLWHKGDALVESGLIGPVTLQAEAEVEVR